MATQVCSFGCSYVASATSLPLCRVPSTFLAVPLISQVVGSLVQNSTSSSGGVIDPRAVFSKNYWGEGEGANTDHVAEGHCEGEGADSILQSEWEAKKKSIAAIIICTCSCCRKRFSSSSRGGGGGATAPSDPHLNTAL